jgi:CRISPR-associated protein Cas5d
MILKDVKYVITAHFELTEKAEEQDNTGKYTSMIRRRIEKGQCFHMPYLGTREFPAKISLADENYTPIQETRSLGLMFYDFVAGFDPTYFMAELVNGVINLRDVEVLR